MSVQINTWYPHADVGNDVPLATMREALFMVVAAARHYVALLFASIQQVRGTCCRLEAHTASCSITNA